MSASSADDRRGVDMDADTLHHARRTCSRHERLGPYALLGALTWSPPIISSTTQLRAMRHHTGTTDVEMVGAHVPASHVTSAMVTRRPQCRSGTARVGAARSAARVETGGGISTSVVPVWCRMARS